MVKTVPTEIDPREFIATVTPDIRRSDAEILLELYTEITKAPPRMWGRSIIGFGEYNYVYESGQRGTWMRAGFSPQKARLSLYIMADFPEKTELYEKLGPHKTGRACLYITRLSRVDKSVLREIIAQSYAEMARRYPD